MKKHAFRSEPEGDGITQSGGVGMIEEDDDAIHQGGGSRDGIMQGGSQDW